MNGRLVELLRRNTDKILDDWQMELELLPPNEDFTHGDLSYEYLSGLFENVLSLLKMDYNSKENPPSLHNYMDFTFSCSPESSACMELHKAGQTALFSILENSNSRQTIFTRSEQQACSRLLQHALAIVLRKEIETCSEECAKPFCPFETGDEHQYKFLGRKAEISSSAKK